MQHCGDKALPEAFVRVLHQRRHHQAKLLIQVALDVHLADTLDKPLLGHAELAADCNNGLVRGVVFALFEQAARRSGDTYPLAELLKREAFGFPDLFDTLVDVNHLLATIITQSTKKSREKFS